jgi:hypothetical protein
MVGPSVTPVDLFWLDWRAGLVVGLAILTAVGIAAGWSYLTRNRSS